VKKWVEDQSWKTEYVCLNLPEALKLPSPEAVEKHFRETHKENIIKPIETHTLGGSAARSLRSPDLVRLVRSVWDDQKRFPLQIATALSQQFAARGLQFFKVNRAITHVSVARPHYLDMEATPVSEGVKRIVDFINAHPKCTRRHLLDALAPAPAVIPVPSAAPPPANAPESPASPGSEPGSAAPVDPSATVAAPNPEQTAIIADLHWLIHQGHVIEFANGILETAKKPAPKPQKPAKPAEAPAEAASQAASEHPAAESAPGVAGTIETEDAQRHVEMEPGSVAEPLAGITTDVVRPGENSPETGETIEQPADATEHHVEQGASGGHPDSEGASESAADVKLESPS
ncbi:MAG TPA: hypothetical protein VHH88_13575, partial [Verrucomicrobiae bacterium]|nr:hypothetical protein [Verrucomicrobiae bacterium]